MNERKNIRLQNWDYASAGDYFITICTKDREHYFGEIIDDKMQLSNVGTIAYVLWYEIKNHTENVNLEAFAVMPNHIHGIITISPIAVIDSVVVGTGHALSLLQQQRKQLAVPPSRFQNIGKNTISSIVGSYKSAVTKYAHRLGYKFNWQSRFYDNIIRDKKSYQTITRYIINNPKNWEKDKFY